MAGLKYRWNIAPKKSYSCSLIAAPVSDGHLNCAPRAVDTAGFPEGSSVSHRCRSPQSRRISPPRRHMLCVAVSLVGHNGVPVQEGCLDSQHVLVVKPAGVDVVMSAAAAV